MSGLGDLARLTDAAYRAALAEMARISTEERRIDSAISRLDTEAQERLTDGALRSGVAALSADLLWRDWRLARRRELMMERAGLLARREEVAQRLARASGRADVAAALHERERDERRRRQGAQREAALEAQMIWSRRDR